MFVHVRIPLTIEKAMVLLVPDIALGADQGGPYLLVVDKDNVVQQRPVKTGQKSGDLRVIVSGLASEDRVVVSGLQKAIPGATVAPAEADRRRNRQMISKFFIERPAFANVLAVVMVVMGTVALYPAAGGAVSERGAADGVGHHAVSRRECKHRHEHRGAADPDGRSMACRACCTCNRPVPPMGLMF